MDEPQDVGAVVVARMTHDTHRATTKRVWVRIHHHDFAPWVSTDDLGNVICMEWAALAVWGCEECDRPATYMGEGGTCLCDKPHHLARPPLWRAMFGGGS